MGKQAIEFRVLAFFDAPNTRTGAYPTFETTLPQVVAAMNAAGIPAIVEAVDFRVIEATPNG